MEVGEERVRKKVVVNTVKVNAQNLQDYFLLFQKQVVGETNWPRSMHSTTNICIVTFFLFEKQGWLLDSSARWA